jgi:hypothetical protein
MRRPLAVAVLVVALSPIAAALSARDALADDAAACTPDVMRLCSSAIPWRERIIACLTENKRKLSPQCSVVFNRKPAKPGKPATEPAVVRYEMGSL